MNQVCQQVTRPRLFLTERDHGRRLSLDEFESAEYKGGFRYEIIYGRLYVSPFPNPLHEELAGRLEDLLKMYAKRHPGVINKVFGPGCVFVPDIEEGVTAPQPDVVAYRDFPEGLSEEEEEDLTWRDFFPVVVVEVISPDAADKDLDRNVELYLRVPSIREYWIVDPRESYRLPSLLVYRRRGQQWQKPIHVVSGDIYTTKLLPGFKLRLNRRA
jgi:Uma2 family endonuclease